MDRFTKTPNILFDMLLKKLNFSELKILLIIVRQTDGWIDKKTGKRKEKDRITYGQFMKKTGLSRRIISKTIESLSKKKLIRITDNSGNVLDLPSKRKGKFHIYYSSLLQHVQSMHILSKTCANDDTNLCTLEHQPVQNRVYNKRNLNKRNITKERKGKLQKIDKIIEEKYKDFFN